MHPASHVELVLRAIMGIRAIRARQPHTQRFLSRRRRPAAVAALIAAAAAAVKTSQMATAIHADTRSSSISLAMSHTP